MPADRQSRRSQAQWLKNASAFGSKATTFDLVADRHGDTSKSLRAQGHGPLQLFSPCVLISSRIRFLFVIAHQAEERLATVLDALPPLCAKLGPQGLACLALSSKRFQTTVNTIVCRGSLVLLDGALDTARDSGQRQDIQAVGWLGALLLRKAPHAAADVTKRLLKLPSVPLDVVKQLITAGVRVSYAQLLAAADSMVAGVEVWVQAQQQLGIQTDIPEDAAVVCCSNESVSAGEAAKNAPSRCLIRPWPLHMAVAMCQPCPVAPA
jgi:hypothetical protein